MENRDYIIELTPKNKRLIKLLHENFNDIVVLESNAFSGHEIVTMIASTGSLVFSRYLKFLNKNREHIKNSKVKIGKKEVELSGYSAKEIQDILDSGGVEKILTQLAGDNE